MNRYETVPQIIHNRLTILCADRQLELKCKNMSACCNYPVLKDHIIPHKAFE